MKQENENAKGGVESDNPTNTEAKLSRRGLLVGTASVGAAAGSGLLTALKPGVAQADDYSSGMGDVAYGGRTRADVAFRVRFLAAKTQKRETESLDDQLANDDEERYEHQRFYASFQKCLPQNSFGEVGPNAFRALRRAMRRRDPALFDDIPLASQADRKLANPQGAFRFEAWGLDSHSTRMPPAPTFRSKQMAAEMGEVYWQAHTRDVPFVDYDTDPLIARAIADLNRFSRPVGPTENGEVTVGTLFRGETPGDLVGPYISQFLWKDVRWGPSLIEQRYELPLAGRDFMVDHANWLNVQRGGAPNEPLVFRPERRYIADNRGLGEYVHQDVLFQAYFNAALILLGYGPDALDPSNPYRVNATQGGFTTLGPPYILDMVTRAGNLSLSGAWFQKWRVHRRLRPEAMGGRMHFKATTGRAYEIDDEAMHSDALAYAFSQNGTGFLSQAFPEGSPTHPAYPAGHATVAGACCTVLKALFNEDFVIPDPVVANRDGTALDDYRGQDLRVGDEINKLANNVSLGRDAAGVHYRTDGVDGLVCGEQQALFMLREASIQLNENRGGWTLTLFDGNRVRIENGRIIEA